MKIFNLVLLATIYLNSPFVFSQENNDRFKDASQLINVWLEAQKDYKDIPGIMGVVVKDQKILWSGAFGTPNLETSLQNNKNTISSICSTSKVFTATIIMKLVEEGKIDLDDKVSDILPKYSVKQGFKESGPVTIRTLLAHSSGLPRDTHHAYWSGPNHHFPTEDELYESLSKLETIHPVGTDTGYSNIGYALLGMIVEKVTGDSYKNFIESNLFQPLDMADSFVEIQSSLYGNRHAIGYTAINRNGKRKAASFYQTKAMQSATGISTTSHDLAKFAMWQFRLAAKTETEIISPSTLKSMYQTQATSRNGNTKRGFGYEVSTDKKGNQWVMHGGACPGYLSFIKMDVTNKMAYAILVNANRVRTLAYVNGLIDIFKRTDSIEHNKEQVLDLEQYTGFYNLNPWNSEYYVAKWGRGLVLLYLPTENLKYSMYHYQHVEGDTFQLLENGELSKEKIQFIREKNGKVVKIKNGGNYHSRVIREIR